MKTNMARLHFTLIALLILALNACGGGGGGGGGGSPAATSVSGSAVKGIIKHGLVEIFAIESGSVASSPLFTTITNASGDYSFTLDASFNGSVMVVISDAEDPGTPTTIACDYSEGCGAINPVTFAREYAFAEDMPMGNTELRALVTNVVGGTPNTAALTVFTTMAAAYAETLGGGLTDANIYSANTRVANLFGINNIITTIPPDITTEDASDLDRNASRYAYLSASIAEIASVNFSGDISQAIGALTTSFVSHGGELTIIDMAGDANDVSLFEILVPANEQASMDPNSGQVANDIENLIMSQLGSVTNITDTEVPLPPENPTELALVKAFVSDVRTWGIIIDQEIQQSNNTFEQQVDSASLVLDMAGPLLDEAMSNLGGVLPDLYFAGPGVNPDLSTHFSPTDPFNPVVAVGTVSVVDSAGMRTIMVDGTLNGIAVAATVEAPPVDAGNSVVGTQFNFNVTRFTVQNAQAINSLESGSIQLTYSQSTDLTPWITGTSLDPMPDPDSASISMTNATVAEKVAADPVSFSGSISFSIVGSRGDGTEVVRDMFGNVVHYNPQSASLSGVVSNSMNNITMSMTATMANASTFMPVESPFNYGYVSSGMGSYAFSNGNNTLTVTTPTHTITFTYDNEPTSGTYQQVLYSDVSTGFSSNFSLGSGYASLQEFIDTSSSYYLSQTVWEWVDGEGQYTIMLPGVYNLAGGSLDGILVYADNIDDENETTYRELTDLSISFSAQLAGLPQALFTLSGDRTGFDDGSFAMNISYGGRRIDLSATLLNDEVTGQIDITNQDGVVLNIVRNNALTDGVIMYDGIEYATIETVNDITIIRYTDGFFETL